MNTIFALTFDFQIFQAVLPFILIVPLLAIVEFGRRQAQSANQSPLGIWIYLPLIVLSCTGCLQGFNGLKATTIYTLGIAGCILVGIALWQSTRSPTDKENVKYHLTALTLAILSVAGYAAIDWCQWQAKANASTEMAVAVLNPQSSSDKDQSDTSESLQLTLELSEADQAKDNQGRSIDRIMAERHRMSMVFLKTGIIALACLIGIYQCRKVAMRTINRHKAK